MIDRACHHAKPDTIKLDGHSLRKVRSPLTEKPFIWDTLLLIKPSMNTSIAEMPGYNSELWHINNNLRCKITFILTGLLKACIIPLQALKTNARLFCQAFWCMFTNVLFYIIIHLSVSSHFVVSSVHSVHNNSKNTQQKTFGKNVLRRCANVIATVQGCIRIKGATACTQEVTYKIKFACVCKRVSKMLNATVEQT